MRSFWDFFSALWPHSRPGGTSYRGSFVNKVRTGKRRGRGAWGRNFRAPLTAAAVCALLALVIYLILPAQHKVKASRGENFTPAYPVKEIEDAVAIEQGARPRAWKYIVIHHSASKNGSAQIFDEWHRTKGWRGLGYHFVIGNGNEQSDGGIVAGSRWLRQESGAHANSAEFNDFGIGICLVGNFQETPPTLAQWSAVRALVRRLCYEFKIPRDNIFGHNDVRRGGSTACPGKFLSIDALKRGL